MSRLFTTVAGVALALCTMLAPAVAQETPDEQGQMVAGCDACESKSKDCCGNDKKKCARCCNDACHRVNFVEGQEMGCTEATCPNALAMKEGRQPPRWHAGNPEYGITVHTDQCRPENTSNY
ncbi:MAG: hypothetical protein AB1758_05090, partial [Candidatus Eremiobacterota bacterium]